MLKYAALLFNTIALLIYQFFFADGITVTQNVPKMAKAESEFTVEIAINKGTIGGFAKLQQDLPEGFTAIQDENNGASFTFSNQSVKFIWMSLPNDKDFKIKYKVKVAAGVSGDKTIAGKFSYVTDNVKQSIDIAPSVITIDGGAGSQPVATSTPTTTSTPATTPTTTSAPQETTTPATTSSTPAVAASSPETTTTPASTASSTPATTSTPTPATQETSSITCTRKIPENVSSNFTVELVINKGNVTGFAKLLETLPAGFTATAGESQGASFSFTDGKVKFVWVSMPAAPEFKITYKVAVAAGTRGSQTIEGLFSYIENDETKKYTIPSSVVSLGGSQPVVATTPTTTTTPAETTSTQTTTTPATTTSTTPTTTEPVATNNTPATTTSTTPATTTASATTDNSTKSLSATTIPAAQGNVNYKVQIAALRNAVEADKLAVRYNINQKIEMEMAEGFTKYIVGAHAEYKAARDAREEIKSKGVNDAFVTAYNSGKRITVQEALMITSQKWFR